MSLSAKAMWVLQRFMQKRKWTKTGGRKKQILYDNTGLCFTYAEAKYFNISTSQFHTILKHLIEVGFLDVEHQGGAYGRDYSRYRLSDRWRNYGTSLFKRVEKQRRLPPGHDVRSWQAKRAKNATVNRRYDATEKCSYAADDNSSGSRQNAVIDDSNEDQNL